jgi:hypothetical protein
MSAAPRGRKGPALWPLHFPASHPNGPWGVNSIGRSWYVCRVETLQSKCIGPVGAPRTNYFDAALNEAERRNRKNGE